MNLTDMKNILFLGGLGCGGAENQMSMVASLLAHNNNVYFIYTGDEEYCAPLLRESSVRLIKLEIPKIYAFSGIDSMIYSKIMGYEEASLGEGILFVGTFFVYIISCAIGSVIAGIRTTYSQWKRERKQ